MCAILNVLVLTSISLQDCRPRRRTQSASNIPHITNVRLWRDYQAGRRATTSTSWTLLRSRASTCRTHAGRAPAPRAPVRAALTNRQRPAQRSNSTLYAHTHFERARLALRIGSAQLLGRGCGGVPHLQDQLVSGVLIVRHHKSYMRSITKQPHADCSACRAERSALIWCNFLAPGLILALARIVQTSQHVIPSLHPWVISRLGSVLACG